MAINQVGFLGDGGSPSGTNVAFLATIDFNGQSIPINTGDITKGISNLVFSLSNPVEMGSINNFFDFLHDNVHIPLDSADITNAIDQIPSDGVFDGIKSGLKKIFSTSLSVTVLNVNVAAKTFTLGVSLPVDLQITSFLTIESIGVVVSKGDTPSSP
jgi:small basic protein